MQIFASTCNRSTGKQLKQLQDGKSPDGRLKEIAFTTNVKDHLPDLTGIFCPKHKERKDIKKQHCDMSVGECSPFGEIEEERYTYV